MGRDLETAIARRVQIGLGSGVPGVPGVPLSITVSNVLTAVWSGGYSLRRHGHAEDKAGLPRRQDRLRTVGPPVRRRSGLGASVTHL